MSFEVDFPCITTTVYKLYTCRSISNIHICIRFNFSLCYVIKINSTCRISNSTTYIENRIFHFQIRHWIMLIPISSCNQSCRVISKNIKYYSIYCCTIVCIKFYTIAICTMYCMCSIFNSTSFSIIWNIWWYQYTCIMSSIACWTISTYAYYFFIRSYIHSNTIIYRISWTSYIKMIVFNSSTRTMFSNSYTYIITTINIKCSSIYAISTTAIS